MDTITIIKRFSRAIASFFLLALVAGIFGVLVYALILPKLSTWPWTAQFSWSYLMPSAMTIIERTEQIVLSPEEGIERSIVGPRTAVVSIIAASINDSERPTLRETGSSISSGVLLTNDGLIVTYAPEKPQSEEKRFTVLFSDGNLSGAQYVAYDAVMRIAYFRTERSNTSAIAFARSTDIRPGRRFIALAGTIDAEMQKVSAGVVGERARTFNLSGKTIASSDAWEGVFLPDRILDPVFDGGAAIAMNGELIGLIGTSVFDGSRQTFILPADALRQSLERVLSGPTEVRQVFGTYYLSLSKASALVLGISRDRGALIYTPSEKPGLAVISGSLAERSGLRYGDIVTAVNGREIDLDHPLSSVLAEIPTGTLSEIRILRGNEERTLRFTR